MKSVYVLFTPSSQHACLEPQMVFTTFHEATEAQGAINGLTHRFVIMSQDHLDAFLRSGAQMLEAGQDYMKTLQAARHGKGTIWEVPGAAGLGTNLVTRGGSAPVHGWYEIASFEHGRSF